MSHEQHISQRPGQAVKEITVPEPGRAWKAARWAEFAILFVAAPAAMALLMRGRLLFPAMWVLALISLLLLLPDRSFDRRRLWNARGLGLVAKGMLIRFAGCAAALALVLSLLEPDRLLQLPRQRPVLWGLIMTLYPILSVYPQEVAFRALYFHRYEKLMPREGVLIAVGAAAFGYAHIIMHNWWAVVFSAVGGVFFGVTYRRSASLLAACVEHALYGCFLFTIGWGWYFYSGNGR